MDTKYKIKRYDLSEDRSLRAWSAADEYLLQALEGIEQKPKELGIYHDRFGFLACHLHAYNPTLVLTHKSQQKAILSNLSAHHLSELTFGDPLDGLDTKMDFSIMKIPKSLDLFQLFLEHIANNSSDDVEVICAFMTRHFSSNLITIAEQYFEVVEQSKAVKKARLLTLKKKKETPKLNRTSTIAYKEQEYQQYLGVFSAKHIDYATQFFLEHIEVDKQDQKILDLASGNGIIAKEIFKDNPDTEIHLMDDSMLAVASGKLNLQGENIHHHLNDDLSIFEDHYFDLIVTNPPFHFEYEVNMQIALQLLIDCYRHLKEGGKLLIVANKHLNYKVHLEPIFYAVETLAEDEKFVIYKCVR